MLGGDLKSDDDWTIALLTNPEVIAVDQQSADSHPVIATDKTVVWLSKQADGRGYYLAVFNVSPGAEDVHYDWTELGLPPAEYEIRDIWERADIGPTMALKLRLRSHACALYRVSVKPSN